MVPIVCSRVRFVQFLAGLEATKLFARFQLVSHTTKTHLATRRRLSRGVSFDARRFLQVSKFPRNGISRFLRVPAIPCS